MLRSKPLVFDTTNESKVGSHLQLEVGGDHQLGELPVVAGVALALSMFNLMIGQHSWRIGTSRTRRVGRTGNASNLYADVLSIIRKVFPVLRDVMSKSRPGWGPFELAGGPVSLSGPLLESMLQLACCL